MGIYDCKVKTREGKDFSLGKLKGKVLLIVNTATGCGFTPQYEGLENLYKEYHDKGLEILDFPCDQFGHQAPGTDDEIHSFCRLKYKTKFDQMKKSDVNGKNQLPLYKFLKEKQNFKGFSGVKGFFFSGIMKLFGNSNEDENDIRWNFTKFIVDRNGNVVGRYSPRYKPEDMEKNIKNLI